MLMGKTIAISGSSGFVGSRLSSTLREENAEVIEVDMKTGTDVTDWLQLERIARIDVLIHLASRTSIPDSFQRPRESLHVNINGTLNMLELCRKYNAKMIFASSSAVYGRPEYLPIDETHPFRGENPYAFSKIVGEELCRKYHEWFGMRINIARSFNIYGPGQASDSMIISMVDQAKTGRILLKDPHPRRDFVFVDDVVEAYLRMIECDVSFDIFNIGTGQTYSVQQVVDVFRFVIRRPVEVQFTGEKREGEIEETRADISKARTLLRWNPKVDVASGIRKILESNE
jgi:nucleoside-diphosphate-sugar epimerase